MPTQADKAHAFVALHQRPGAFVIPNPWDAGSAKVLASLGFEALATTSSGFAFTLGEPDGAATVTRELALANAASIAAATPLPISGDLENLFAHDAHEAALTIPMAAAAGLVGCSIEDHTRNPADPIYPLDVAVARVKAAVAAARALPFPFTLTARAENYLHGRPDLADTIIRLKAFADVGADVVYAPGLASLDDIAKVVQATSKPVNVIVSGFNAHLTVAELARIGVKRISVGGALSRAAITGFMAAAREIRDFGTFTYGHSVISGGAVNSHLRRSS